MTKRIPRLSVSSLMLVMPSITLFFTKSAILIARSALFTWYGNSLIISDVPFLVSSISTTPRKITFPRPVLYAFTTPERPQMIPPVGKSGAGINEKRSSSLNSGLWSSAKQASITSVRLCGGTAVAIPTAIPAVPLTSKFGNLLGNTVGSTVDSSKLGTKGTVSLSRSASNS